jgi:Aspartyl protease
MKGLLLFLLSIPLFTFGQDIIDFKQGTILQRQFCDTIPFEYVRNKMIVQVKINGQSKRFIFDTGATLIISDQIQEEMRNPFLGKNLQIDATQRQKQISVVNVKEFNLGNLTFQNIPSVVTEIKSTNFLTCFNYDGFIGSNVLRNCIVQIDVDKKHIILTNNINKLNIQNAYKNNLTLDNQSNPFVELNLNNKIKFTALFDSGADDFITISSKINQKALNKGYSKVLNQGYGIGAVGMHGLGDAENKSRTLCSNIKFGNTEITDFITEVSTKSYNAVGMQLADYGTITIDYINKQFYFEAKKQSQLYKHQKTIGFSFQPEDTYYSIGNVWSGTQSEKIGLKSGFQILKLDDIDISKRTPELDCSLFLSRPLSNGKIKITYKDDKEQIKVAELYEE